MQLGMGRSEIGIRSLLIQRCEQPKSVDEVCLGCVRNSDLMEGHDVRNYSWNALAPDPSLYCGRGPADTIIAHINICGMIVTAGYFTVLDVFAITICTT